MQKAGRLEFLLIVTYVLIGEQYIYIKHVGEARFKNIELWCLCCIIMSRWINEQPGIQKFRNGRGHYQSIWVRLVRYAKGFSFQRFVIPNTFFTWRFVNPNICSVILKVWYSDAQWARMKPKRAKRVFFFYRDFAVDSSGALDFFSPLFSLEAYLWTADDALTICF